MAHAPEKRAIVRAAYVHERLPIEQAAAKADVAERTAQRWKSDAADEGDDWDKSRAVKAVAGQGFDLVIQSILEDYLTVHQVVIGQIRDGADIGALDKAEALSRLADAFTKTMAGIGKSSPKHLRLAIANEVIQLMGDFVRARFPQHANAFVEILSPFAEALAQHYG